MNEMILNRKQTPIEIALDIDDTGHTTAKKLYKWLELDTSHYNRWVKQSIIENPYASCGEDYSPLVASENQGRGNYAQDYLLSASFAKKLAMSSRSPKGEETRDYFIKVEDALVKATEQKQKSMTQAELILMQAQQLVEQERRMLALESHNEVQDARLDELKEKQDAMETKLDPVIGMDYFTITGYIGLKKYRVNPDDYKTLGKEASKLSKQKGYKIGSAPHPVYGRVGTYHTDILKEVFDSFPGKW